MGDYAHLSPYELQRLLSERERQLAERAVENARLTEENQILRTVVEKLQDRGQEREGDVNVLDALKEEFSHRLGQLEKKVKELSKERDVLRKQLQSAPSTTASTTSAVQFHDKQQELELLRNEGIRMASQIAQYEATIKKLRSQQQQDQTAFSKLRDKLSQTESALARAAERITVLEEVARKYEIEVAQMKSVLQQTQRQLEEKETQSKAALEQVNELRRALEKAWAECADQNRLNQELTKQHRTEMKELEQRLKEDYHRLLREQVEQDLRKETALQTTIQQLRESLSAQNTLSGKREEEYQRELDELRAKNAELTQRLHDVMNSEAESTKPLLRQIQHLERLLTQKHEQFDLLEKSLRHRLVEEEAKALAALQAEREAKNQVQELRKELLVVQSDLESERAAHQRTRAQWQREHETLRHTQTQLAEVQLQYEMSVRQCHDREQEIKRLSDTLNNVQSEWSARVQHLEKELNHLHRQQQQQPHPLVLTMDALRSRQEDTPQNKTTSNEETQSRKGNIDVHFSSETASLPLSLSSSSASTNAVAATRSIGESLQKSNSMSVSLPLTPVTLEKLRLALQQREGEVELLNAKIAALERAKRLVEDELVTLTKHNEELQARNAQLQQQHNRFKELESRYLTALELLGEQSEKVEEVTQDLHDWRTLYKQQINSLCLQIEDLRMKNDALTQQLLAINGTSSISRTSASHSGSQTQNADHPIRNVTTVPQTKPPIEQSYPLKDKR